MSFWVGSRDGHHTVDAILVLVVSSCHQEMCDACRSAPSIHQRGLPVVTVNIESSSHFQSASVACLSLPLLPFLLILETNLFYIRHNSNLVSSSVNPTIMRQPQISMPFCSSSGLSTNRSAAASSMSSAASDQAWVLQQRYENQKDLAFTTFLSFGDVETVCL